MSNTFSKVVKYIGRKTRNGKTVNADGISVSGQTAVTNAIVNNVVNNYTTVAQTEEWKCYTITEDRATIPDDANEVYIKISDTSKTSFYVYLPSNPTHLRRIVVVADCTNQYGSGTGTYVVDGRNEFTTYASGNYIYYFIWNDFSQKWNYAYDYTI